MRSSQLIDGKVWDGSDPAATPAASAARPERRRSSARPPLTGDRQHAAHPADQRHREKVGRLKAALIEAGFEVIDESGLTIDLPARVETVRPDVILIDTESPGRDVMEQVVLVSRDQPRRS
jgi:hypothetical protein